MIFRVFDCTSDQERVKNKKGYDEDINSWVPQNAAPWFSEAGVSLAKQTTEIIPSGSSGPKKFVDYTIN